MSLTLFFKINTQTNNDSNPSLGSAFSWIFTGGFYTDTNKTSKNKTSHIQQ